MKTKLILSLIILTSIGTIYIQYKDIKKKDLEISQKTDNYKIAISKIESYKTESGKNYAIIKQQNLTMGELKSTQPNLLQKIKELKLKNNRIESITDIQTTSIVDIITMVKDSIELIKKPYLDSLKQLRYSIDTLRVKSFNYTNKNYKINGVVDTVARLHIEHIDSIFSSLIKYKEVETPIIRWFYDWKYELILMNQDSTTKINYGRFIKIVKR